jgi:hypothetical protein
MQISALYFAQAMYNEFSTAIIQIDKDFSAKLSGYGCVTHNVDTDLSNTSTVSGSRTESPPPPKKKKKKSMAHHHLFCASTEM